METLSRKTHQNDGRIGKRVLEEQKIQGAKPSLLIQEKELHGEVKDRALQSGRKRYNNVQGSQAA